MSTVNLMLSTEALMLPDPTKLAFVSSVATHNTEYTSNPGSPNHGSSHTSAAISLNGSSASSHSPLVPPSNADASIFGTQIHMLLKRLRMMNMMMMKKNNV